MALATIVVAAPVLVSVIVIAIAAMRHNATPMVTAEALRKILRPWSK